MMDLERVFSTERVNHLRKNCLFSSPAEAERKPVWSQSLKSTCVFETVMEILITLIRLLMFRGNWAEAGLGLHIDFTSESQAAPVITSALTGARCSAGRHI